MSDQKPLFSFLMLTFNRPHLLKGAVEAFFAQTYSNWEAIIIDNGSTPETQEYLAILERQDKRIKVVHFKTNQYVQHHPHNHIPICYNAALDVARGEYIRVQEDDDYVSPDFVERMVALFQENPECTTAAGQSVDIINGVEHVKSNYRPRYMPGHLLVKDILKKDGTIMFGSSGGGLTFVVKRDILIKAGGFHKSFDLSFLYGIIPFGSTGYDDEAVEYFRRHEAQLSALFLTNGYSCLPLVLALFKDWKLQEKWEASFGRQDALFMKNALLREKYEEDALTFAHVVYLMRWEGAWRLFSQAYNSWWFWKRLPYTFWKRKWVLKKTVLDALKRQK